MFSGHSGYVHCVCLRNGGCVLSGAEDGTVMMWGEEGRDCEKGDQLYIHSACLYIHVYVVISE